jgi:hypothetical protein
MAGSNTAVFGIFRSRAGADRCVDLLLANGFRGDDVSVLAADRSISKEMATEKNTKAPEGTATGATAGGAIGGTLGLLAGIGAIAIPGLGPFIAAGPIMAALAGIGSGAVTGGVIGALIGLGIPEYEAKRYEGHVKDGGILVSAHCDNSEWVDRAKEIFKQAGAEDISSAGEKAASTHGVVTEGERSRRAGVSDVYEERDAQTEPGLGGAEYRRKYD